MSKKIFTIFAGVNGAGKSTLYNSPILEKEKLIREKRSRIKSKVNGR